MYYTKFDTKFCEIILVGEEDVNGYRLKMLHMNTGEGKRCFEIDPLWERNDTVFQEVIDQIKAYERGELFEFKVNLDPDGTDYQKKVWQVLFQIPYGETVTYKDIAREIGNENASRAVGSANGKNPIPIIVPCHRVIGANGKLTGFAHGVHVKEQLIEHEKTHRL